ncbi:MAG: two-component system sensor histidine kinase NtrB, partial [Sphingomicrobium sp.]
MLYKQLDLAKDEPLDGGLRWLVPALVAAAAASGAVLFYLVDQPMFAGLFFAGFVAMLVAAFVIDRRGARRIMIDPVVLPDLQLIAASLALSDDPAALTAPDGTLRSVNPAYKDRFGHARSPFELGADDEARDAIAGARDHAWRGGEGETPAVNLLGGPSAIHIERVGAQHDQLLWRFANAAPPDQLTISARRIAGAIGERLASAGVLAALVDSEGRLVAANRPFADRAIGGAPVAATPPRLSDLVETSEEGLVRLVAEGDNAQPMRGVHLPLDPGRDDGAGTLFLFDFNEDAGLASSTNVQVLLEMLPIGLALVDRDGRFLTMNKAFRIAGGLGEEDMPAYPGDLVVKEDKAPVADAVRRNARGPSMSGDLPVRLRLLPGEPVALTVAGLRGLGDAAVLLLLKDNSEEAKLKRQVAQATKMQAVGQLAGGVAHDFNNILTAILGHCDLMLMRHTPGDSDYDDMQQIKSNSNRAAGLTRQLLAFSRQQTLRPQLLQLPDVVSEVSHLLKRLLGETVQLSVKHGRDLGVVRADPGQLEQVIVNLSVNARDAMVAGGGGTLTIQTYSIRAEQVADLGSDILPVADYTALSIADTGSGIAPAILGKVFEPFFTT